jgi:hypothetical protein
METQTTTTPAQHEIVTTEQMLAEIYENTRKTKNYMKWQLIITIALVVIPLIATIAIIPFAMSSLSSVYGVGGAASGEGASLVDPSQADQIIELLK